jgi:hypothetical protein
VPLARIVEAIAAHAPIHQAELVGLAPRAALDGFPAGTRLIPGPRTIEDALSA